MESKIKIIKDVCISRIEKLYMDDRQRKSANSRLENELELISCNPNNIDALYVYYKICEAGANNGMAFFLRGSITSLLSVALLNKTYFYIDPFEWKLPIMSAIEGNNRKPLSLEINCPKGYYPVIEETLKEVFPGKTIIPLYGHTLISGEIEPHIEHHGFGVFEEGLHIDEKALKVVNGTKMLATDSELLRDEAVFKILTLENDDLSRLVSLINDSDYEFLSDINAEKFYYYNEQMLLYSDVYEKGSRELECLKYAHPQNIKEYVAYFAALHASYNNEPSFEEKFSDNTYFSREDFAEAIAKSGFGDEYAYKSGIAIGRTSSKKRDELLIQLDMDGVKKGILDEASRVLYLMPRSHILYYAYLHYGLAFLEYKKTLSERGKAKFIGTGL